MLSVEHVTKRFGRTTAVDDVSFVTTEGRIFGLLGPNGAGKTSTIRMITYITTPDDGRITFWNKVVGPWSQREMGYLPEERGLYRRMKVGEQLEYLARLKGMSRADARAEIQHWLAVFDASSWKDKRVDELSKGMQQKIQFISTIAHRPSLMIFDEPFSGLDPINSELLQTTILELKSHGCTILFASHRMEQVEQLCDDICMMAEGRVVLQGTVREIKESFGRDTVRLAFTGTSDFLESLAAEQRVLILNRTHHSAEIRLVNGTPSRTVLEHALREVEHLHHFEEVEPSLNEIFISVMGGRENGERNGRGRTTDSDVSR